MTGSRCESLGADAELPPPPLPRLGTDTLTLRSSPPTPLFRQFNRAGPKPTGREANLAHLTISKSAWHRFERPFSGRRRRKQTLPQKQREQPGGWRAGIYSGAALLFCFTPSAEVAEKRGLEDRVLLGGRAADNVGWRGFRREGFRNTSHADGGRAASKPPLHLPGAERGRR